MFKNKKVNISTCWSAALTRNSEADTHSGFYVSDSANLEVFYTLILFYETQNRQTVKLNVVLQSLWVH